MIKQIYTLGPGKKKKTFQYDWSPGGAVLLRQEGKPRIDRSFLQDALYHFSGQTVDGGFSQDAAPLEGFGKWVEMASKNANSRKLSPRHGSFMAAILCKEFGVRSTHQGHKVVLTFPLTPRLATPN